MIQPRNRVETPNAVAGLSVVRVDESTNAELAAPDARNNFGPSGISVGRKEPG